MTNSTDHEAPDHPERKEGIDGNHGQPSSESPKTRAADLFVLIDATIGRLRMGERNEATTADDREWCRSLADDLQRALDQLRSYEAEAVTAAAKALYEGWVVEDFGNEYAPWEQLGDKDTWLARAELALRAVFTGPRGGVTHVVADEGGAYDYVQRLIASYDNDPPSTDFQRGHLACAEVIAKEAFVPPVDGGGRVHVPVAALRQQLKTMAQIRRQDGALGHALIADRAALCIGNLLNHVTRLLPPGTFLMHSGLYHQVQHLAAFDDGAVYVTATQAGVLPEASVVAPIGMFHVVGHEGDALSWAPVEPGDDWRVVRVLGKIGDGSAIDGLTGPPPHNVPEAPNELSEYVPDAYPASSDDVEPPPLCGS